MFPDLLLMFRLYILFHSSRPENRAVPIQAWVARGREDTSCLHGQSGRSADQVTQGGGRRDQLSATI